MTDQKTPWIDGMTLQQALAATVQRHGRRDAMVFPQLDLRWSYETFQAEVERVAHVTPPNPHNAFYLETKAQRSGHLF